MAASIIDGKKLAEEIKDGVAREVKNLAERGITPGLAVVLAGSNAASQVYVRKKRKACESLSIALPAQYVSP